MKPQEARRQARASANPAQEPCLCREMLAQLRTCLGVSPAVQAHFDNSRIEFLKGIRAIIDQRIEYVASGGRQGTKINVE